VYVGRGPRLLIFRNIFKIDIQTMTYEIWIYPRYIIRAPSKYIQILN